MKPPSLIALVGSLIILVTGCVVGPDYKRPAAPIPTAWKEPHLNTNGFRLSPNWWGVFNDPELDFLESEAVLANQDLKRAVARVAEARALARASAADWYPGLGAGAAFQGIRHSAGTDNVLPHLETSEYSTSFDLSYEIDVWGRVRRTVEAVKADANAVSTDLQVVLLTLTADVARTYQLLRSLDNEKLVIQASIALRKDTVQLQQTRFQAGLINEVDVSRSKTELANVEAELHAVNRQRAQTEHALAVLCGRPPANFSVSARPASLRLPEIPPGLPAELLQRRPDVLEAEQRLEASNARIGVAKAAFFPRIKLTGSAGFASADLGSLFDWPSRIAQFGPSLSVPIFQGGENQANLRAAGARYEQSLAAYRETILRAFRDVEDSLSDLSALAFQSEAVTRALTSARDTATLANERYQRGLSSYLEVVDAQRAALEAERQDTQLRGQRAVATILLVKALGGGWEPPAYAVNARADSR